MLLESGSRKTLVLVGLLSFVCGSAVPADLLDALGLRKKARVAEAFGEEQIAGALRDALDVGVRRAVETLGKADGFLGDARVRIPLPSGMRRIERGLRRLGQGELADQFETALNRAAERAVPEAAPILVDSIRQLTLADAREILRSTNSAATDFFRRTSESQLRVKLLPVVRGATAEAGVTGRYKELLDRTGLSGGGFFGNLGRSLGGSDNLDLDEYVTRKALDGLFEKLAAEEIRIRENPEARTTDLLRKVFGDALPRGSGGAGTKEGR